jgi:hypothetical protein
MSLKGRSQMKKVATPRINRIVKKLILLQEDVQGAIQSARTDESETYLREVLAHVQNATRDADFARINERGA